VNIPTMASAFNPTRRRWLLQSGMAAGALVLQSTRSFAAAAEEISRTAEAIHQEVAFKAKPERIFEALTDAASFQKVESLGDAMQSLDIAGHPARISREPGSSFSLFGDYIVGQQIELVVNQRIVQAWRVASWDPGIFSIARFQLNPQDAGTKLVFDHTGFPAGTAEHLASGWHAHYWDPLRKFLGE
jgi:activator of HSP90 ATPase